MKQTCKVVVYTKDHCPYCTRAKALLQSKGVTFEEIDLSQRPELVAEVQILSGRRTVPQIFIADKPVGGFDDLSALDRSGALDRLLSGV